MPTAPIANGAQLTVRMKTGAQDSAVVLGGYWTEAPAVTLAEGQRWLNAFWGAVRSRVAVDTVCVSAELRDLSASPGAALEIGAPTSPSGAETGQVAILAAAWVCRWSTSHPGRRGRGRTFLPGLTEAALNNDGRTVDEAQRAALQASLTSAYLSAMNPGAGNIVPAVISRTDLTARQIQAVTVQPVAGIQRRRMR